MTNPHAPTRSSPPNARAGSNPAFRLRGGHETGRSPGTATPATPSQPTAANIAHADPGKVCLMSAGAPHVGDPQAAAGTQHPHRFVDCFLPSRTSSDIVDREIGDH